MRTKYLLWTALLFCSSHFQAQPGLLTEGNEWYYNVYCLQNYHCGYTYYNIGDDVQIAGKWGKTVHVKYLEEGASSAVVSELVLRESGDTVFRYSPEAEAWHMLYHFGAQPGDVWEIQVETYMGYGPEEDFGLFRVVVDSISQITISGTAHRVIYTAAWSDGVQWSEFHFGYSRGRIIEGIGPVDLAHGLEGQSVVQMLPLQSPSFACLLANGALLWGSANSPCNALSVISSEYGSNIFSVFPNPASTILTLHLPGHTLTHATLHDMQGREVHSVPLGTGEQVVDVRHLPKGMYLVKATEAGGGVYVKKVVVE